MGEVRMHGIAVPVPQCLSCAHLDRVTFKCSAFDNQPIPEDIQFNLWDHRYPYPGDRGVRFTDVS